MLRLVLCKGKRRVSFLACFELHKPGRLCCGNGASPRFSGFLFAGITRDDLIDGNAQGAQFGAQSGAVEAEQFARLRLVAVGVTQNTCEQDSFRRWTVRSKRATSP